MKIVAARNMPFAREAFSALGDVTVLDGRHITADDVRDAGLLAVRSTTRIDRAMLEGSRVRFVGTATIGTDHLDIPYLEQAGIHWCSAAGCNADSVSEYLATALLCLGQRHGFQLEGKTIGVVGVGNVGTRVAARANTLGMKVLPNDPPRERVDGRLCRLNIQHPTSNVQHRTETTSGTSTLDVRCSMFDVQFTPLDKLLAESDVITLHTPFTREGPDATFHLANDAFFEQLKPGCVFVNAARGPIVDTDALLRALDSGRVSHVVIDTWEGEPDFRPDLLGRVDIGTPHIAGHSYEGKYNGTTMVYREACRFLGCDAPWTPDALLPEPPVPSLVLEPGGRDDETVLWEAVRQVYEIEADDRRLREALAADEPERRRHFDGLRGDYPVRREFRFTTAHADDCPASLRAKLAGLGFRVADLPQNR